MKRYIYIFTLFIFGLMVSSCAKDEIEAPSESTHPQAVRVENQATAVEGLDVNTTTVGPTRAQINDDGDDEDEGLKGGSKKGTKSD